MKKFLLSLAAVTLAINAYADETNLLQNPGFESWTDGVADHWKSASTASNATVSQSTNAHSGAYAALVAGASSNKRLGSEEITLAAGSYTFSFYAKAATEGVNCKVRPGYVPVDSDNKVGTYVYTTETDPVLSLTEWSSVSYSFDLAEATKLCLVVMNPKNGGDVLVDDASLVCTASGEQGGEQGGEETPDVDLSGVISVAEAQAAEAGTVVKVYGTVAALATRGAVIGDETGYIYYYNANIGSTLAIGDEVVMEGAVSAYGGFNQLTNTATVTKVAEGQAVTYPEAVVLDGPGAEAWFNDPKIEYVSVTGTMNISGNYYNLNIEGAETAVGSIVYPIDAVKTNLTNGVTVTVKGFAMYTSSSKYINIVATEAKSEGESTLTHIANTQETAYTTAQAIALIDDPNSDLSDVVFVKGIVSKVQSFNSNYGEITYWLDDDTFEVYNGLGLNGEKFTSKEDLTIGDEVIIKGTITKYQTTYEFNTASEIVYIKKFEGEVEEPTIEEISIEDFLDKADTKTTYQLTGVVTEIANTTYGNLYIEQDGVSLYIYGVLDLEGQAKNFASLNVEVGDTLTVQGVYTTYNGNAQIKNAQFVKVVKAGGESAISSVVANRISGEIYNLAGQRVSCIGAQGIYVVNGKKVIVR